jgi:hypothetical protein
MSGFNSPVGAPPVDELPRPLEVVAPPLLPRLVDVVPVEVRPVELPEELEAVPGPVEVAAPVLAPPPLPLVPDVTTPFVLHADANPNATTSKPLLFMCWRRAKPRDSVNDLRPDVGKEPP